jgi:hypothetical protein
LLKWLNLRGSETEEVWVEGKKLENMKEVAHWMAIAWLHTTKAFSVMSLCRTLMSAWGPTRKVTWRLVGDDKFVIQAACLGDWNRIMEEGPWIFRESGLIVEKYDGITQHETIKLDQVMVWIRINRIPELMRKKEIVWDLAAHVGEVVEVELTPWNFGVDYIRARVKLDVFKPLATLVTLTLRGNAPMFL